MKNKHDILQFVKVAILGLLVLPLMACQTAATGPAVICGKCKTAWVKTATASTSGKGFMTYRDTKTMACPDCESAVKTFFKTGSLKHHCAHCGDTLVHCEAH